MLIENLSEFLPILYLKKGLFLYKVFCTKNQFIDDKIEKLHEFFPTTNNFKKHYFNPQIYLFSDFFLFSFSTISSIISLGSLYTPSFLTGCGFCTGCFWGVGKVVF